jgi:hypothetical protein
MGVGVLGAVVVMAGGFTVARSMRFRRRIREDDERRVIVKTSTGADITSGIS